MTLPVFRSVGGRQVLAFRLFGYAGFAAACVVALSLTAARGLSAGTEIVLIAGAVATFLALAAATRRLVGHELLCYYHHEIAVLGITALLATALGAPVLGHLDATTLGLGAFLAFGRIGCLHAGCCHGRPARRGMVYGAEHAEAGFPGYLTGLRLTPVQAVEAAGVGILVVAGAALVVAGAAAGSGFAFYVAGYALLRFPLELARGDAGRRWWRGLSEAQWTSLVIATTVAALGLADVLPGPVIVHLIPVALLLPAAALQLAGRFGRVHRALDPRHVRELASLLGDVEPRPAGGPPAILSTSLGLRVSHGFDGGCEHWSLSGATPPATRTLARVVLWLRRPGAEAEVVSGPEGIVHVVVPR
jgi:hypothetical protein